MYDHSMKDDQTRWDHLVKYLLNRNHFEKWFTTTLVHETE